MFNMNNFRDIERKYLSLVQVGYDEELEDLLKHFEKFPYSKIESMDMFYDICFYRLRCGLPEFTLTEYDKLIEKSFGENISPWDLIKLEKLKCDAIITGIL